MKRTLSIILSAAIWAAIIAYIVWSVRLGDRRRDEVRASGLTVTVADSAEIEMIRAGDVEKWILDADLWPVGENIDDIDTRAITECVARHNFVRSVKTYVDLEGTVSVTLTQRRPVMRFINNAGYDFYITEDRHVIPVSPGAAHYVPVITGDFGLPFDKKQSGPLADLVGEAKKEDKNYLFICKLINFVKYIDGNDFWSSQIVQINVTYAPVVYGRSRSNEENRREVELIPRVGDHVILLGQIDGYKEKLDRLIRFYKGALDKEGWNRWDHINLKYDNQVVCSNR